jgi:signal transduction histidine kinase
VAASITAHGPTDARALLPPSLRVDRPGTLRVLLRRPGDPRFRDAEGRAVECEALLRALDRGKPSAWLTRDEAPALGLPPRRAAVGYARVAVGGERVDVAVVASAERVRARQLRSEWRLGLGVLVAAGLTLAFGTVALRRQRRGLLLERELSLAAAARARDAELARAARAAMMGTFAMGIAHEVGTPLGIIAGRAEQMASRTEGDERTARAVRAIQEQADRIQRTIRGFLSMARGERLDLGDRAPGEVVRGAAALVDHRFEAARVALEVDVPEGLPTVRGDREMLQHALVNLLLNACEACPPGGHVRITARSDNDGVVFTVDDDGTGISDEAAARATEPFFTTKGHGSGLGLAITTEIVKMHRGTFTLRAAVPRGTTATVTIPAGGQRGA